MRLKELKEEADVASGSALSRKLSRRGIPIIDYNIPLFLSVSV